MKLSKVNFEEVQRLRIRFFELFKIFRTFEPGQAEQSRAEWSRNRFQNLSKMLPKSIRTIQKIIKDQAQNRPKSSRAGPSQARPSQAEPGRASWQRLGRLSSVLGRLLVVLGRLLGVFGRILDAFGRLLCFKFHAKTTSNCMSKTFSETIQF